MPTVGQLADVLAARSNSLPSLRTQARVRYEGPEDRFRSSQMIVVAVPDQLRIDVMNPFGISYTLASNGEQLSAYNRGDGILYRGRASAHNIGRLSGLALEPRMLVAVVRGLPPRLAVVGEGAVTADGDAWSWSRDLVEGGRLTVAFDPETLQVRAISVEDYPGIGSVGATFSDFFGAGPNDLARHVEIELDDGGTLELSYERVWPDINPSPGTFQVDVPAEVERIDLDEYIQLD